MCDTKVERPRWTAAAAARAGPPRDCDSSNDRPSVVHFGGRAASRPFFSSANRVAPAQTVTARVWADLAAVLEPCSTPRPRILLARPARPWPRLSLSRRGPLPRASRVAPRLARPPLAPPRRVPRVASRPRRGPGRSGALRGAVRVPPRVLAAAATPRPARARRPARSPPPRRPCSSSRFPRPWSSSPPTPRSSRACSRSSSSPSSAGTTTTCSSRKSYSTRPTR